jgi:hypothetical protein
MKTLPNRFAVRLWHVMPFLSERVQDLRLNEPLEIGLRTIRPGREVFVVFRGEEAIGYLPDSITHQLKLAARDYAITAKVRVYPSSMNRERTHLAVKDGFCEVVISLSPCAAITGAG